MEFAYVEQWINIKDAKVCPSLERLRKLSNDFVWWHAFEAYENA